MAGAEVPKPRTQPAEVRREQILDAAARVLIRQGLDDTTIADVSTEAGIAKGTVYLYFGSKSQLIGGLQARYNSDLAARTSRLLDGAADRWDRLDEFVADLVDYHESHFELHRVLFHDAAFDEEEATRPLVELLAQFVAEGARDGAFAVDDPTVTAVFLLSGLHGILLPYLHQQSHDRRGFARTAGALVRRTLS